MALIKMGQVVAEARGAIAGMVFSRNTYGAYIRQKVSPVQPRTVAQSIVRALLAAVSQAWRGLTDVQRLNWNTVAPTFSKINVFGDNVPLTGFGLYGKLNRNLQSIGEALITDPPLQEAVAGFTSLALIIDNAEAIPDDELQIAYTPAIPANQKAILYATAALSPGKNFVKSEYRQVDVFATADVSPFSFGDAYFAVFGVTPAAGAKAFVKVRPLITASGISGTELQASVLAI